MNKKSAADMTVEEFAIELMLMWDDVITIPMIERDKNNRSYLGKRNPSKGALPFSNQTRLAMRRVPARTRTSSSPATAWRSPRS